MSVGEASTSLRQKSHAYYMPATAYSDVTRARAHRDDSRRLHPDLPGFRHFQIATSLRRDVDTAVRLVAVLAALGEDSVLPAHEVRHVIVEDLSDEHVQ